MQEAVGDRAAHLAARRRTAEPGGLARPDRPAAGDRPAAAAYPGTPAGRRAGRRIPRSGPPMADRPGDERLPMLFGCCHPALTVEARLALTLRAVVGMTTTADRPGLPGARADDGPAAGPGQAQDHPGGHPVRHSRSMEDLPPRLDDVLTVIYLSYNAGYLDPSPAGRELTDDAVWLAELVGPGAAGAGRGLGVAVPADLPVLAYAGPVRPSGTAGPARGSGPDAAGTGWRSPARTAIWSRPPSLRRPGRLPAAGGAGRLPRERSDLGGDGLAADPHSLRHAASGSTRRR